MQDAATKPVRLDFASGGWALALGAALCAGVVAWSFLGAGGPRRSPRVDQAGFDLSNLSLDRSALVAATTPDALPALDEPGTLGAAEAKAFRLPERGKLLVDPDRVVGVVVNGEARAYPLRLLAWHEVVNDVVGGAPIVVTWGALADAVRVFDRRVGARTLRFAASGLLWSSTLVLHDRPDVPSEAPWTAALWSPLHARCVAGPRLGEALAPVRHQVVPWSAWVEAHPATRVMAPDPARGKLYRRDPYHSYVGSDILRFPVAPLPPAGAAPAGMPPLAKKTPCIIVGPAGERRVFPLPLIARRTDAERVWTTRVDGAPVTFRYFPGDPASASVETALEVVHAAWFAWYAAHPGDATLAE